MKDRITAGKIWSIIWPPLFYFGVSIVIEIAITFIVEIIYMAHGHFKYNDVINYITEFLYSNALYLTLVSALCSIPPALLFMHFDKKKELSKNRYVQYKGIFPLKYLLIIPFGYGTMLAANYFVSLLTMVMPDFMINSYTETEQLIYGASIFIQILSAGIAGPIIEELIFRGLVYKRLKTITSVKIAAVLSALYFGVFHMNWVQAPYAFIIGLLAVFLYEKYKTIWAPIIYHMVCNIISVIISSSASTVELSDLRISPLVQAMIILVMMIYTAGIGFGFGILIQKVVNPRKIEEKNNEEENNNTEENVY